MHNVIHPGVAVHSFKAQVPVLNPKTPLATCRPGSKDKWYASPIPDRNPHILYAAQIAIGEEGRCLWRSMDTDQTRYILR
ncbi:MAG: hypothetical protein D6791_07555 [Chloroflexi bacterium]|nr:MAG: hypothetical protein D6791_07555 [Chloroflexota bacterium]